jgi:hypothetical protein
MIIDLVSIITALMASVTTFWIGFEKFSAWILCHFVKMCLVFPKTSKFKELKNKPVTKISINKFSDASMAQCIYDEVKKDANLKIYGVASEVILIFKALFYDREDILLNAMDFIVISKMGMELVIVENEEKGGYDRSLFIDLTSYRQTIFNAHAIISLAIGLIALIASGNEEIREMVISKVFPQSP